jgi:Short C-terminal domain
MFVRRRPLLRAAAIGGGAYMAGKRRAERSAQATGGPQSVSDQIAQLSSLHDQGALTDAEFASAKSRLLGSLSRASVAMVAALLILLRLTDTLRCQPTASPP